MQEDLNLWPQFHRVTAVLLLPLCLVLLHPFPPKQTIWVIQISSQNTDLRSLFAWVGSNQDQFPDLALHEEICVMEGQSLGRTELSLSVAMVSRLCGLMPCGEGKVSRYCMTC